MLLLHLLYTTLELLDALLHLGNKRLFIIKLGFDRVQVRYLLLCRNKIFRRLGIVLSNVLLLFVELVDDLILLCNFIIQRLDVVISTSLFLLNLVNGKLNIFNVLLDNIDRSSMLFSLSSQLNSGSLFSSQSVLHFAQLSFTIGLHFISLSLSVSVDAEISLLLLKGFGEGLDVILKGVHLSFKIGRQAKANEMKTLTKTLEEEQ